MLDASAILEPLNPAQREAVSHGEGPLLILAGAGSGKTRVITHRIAYVLAQHGAAPREIVAMTFTNKAADEMRERVEQLVGYDIAGAYIGTFHAFGLRVLRTHAMDAGYAPGFVVYDTADQQAVVRAAMKEIGIDTKEVPPRRVQTWISRRKNQLIDPDGARDDASTPLDRLFADVYEHYESALRRSDAVDFDDLLVKVIRLLRRREDIADRYARRIRWLLVDEYQDTNPMQYALIQLLGRVHANVCCVGDEDQSIYGFRGADIRNILDFTRDFPDARIIKLEQNYRSTGRILEAASGIIQRNLGRHDKTLWTENPTGLKLRLHLAQDDREEARWVAERIVSAAEEIGCPLEQVAILYRTNATSRPFEDRLTAAGVPYRVLGSLRFYERKEVKDLLAWLRMLVHPHSDQDFLRAVSTPPRGIGAKTLEELGRLAAEQEGSLWSATQHVVRTGAGLGSRARLALTRFTELVRDLSELSERIATSATVTSVLDAIDYPSYLEKSYPSDYESRGENLDALAVAAQEHDEGGAPEGLAGFLDRVSLRSDSEDVRGDRGPALMTVHTAKGLEFDAVFLVGLNEALFPHARSLHDEHALEEERRLMYVAMTRARKLLTLSAAHFRRAFGDIARTEPSRFLGEIPAETVEQLDGPRPMPGSRLGRTALGRGAEPRAPREAEPSSSTGFRPGMRVRHPSFGSGRILSTTGEGNRLTLVIRFDRKGRKRISAAHTTLVPER
jgi:DNA helicase-2/ATP-dependent DNA helicase PcrA